MSKNSSFVLGLVIILLLSGFLIWWFVDSNEAEEVKTTSIKQTRSSLLNDKTIEKIKELKIHGNFPITNEDNYNNEDLFN